MRVNEREIVRIGIIKLRSAESLCKRVCKRGSEETVAYPHFPSNNPYATTMRNTVCKTYLNPTHTYLIMR